MRFGQSCIRSHERLVTQISMNLAKQNKRVAYYNLEMSDKQVYERLVSRTGGIDLTRLIKKRDLVKNFMAALQDFLI